MGAAKDVFDDVSSSGITNPLDDLVNGAGGGSDIIDSSGGGSGVKYTLTEENQWGWITLYVVTIVLAILLNLGSGGGGVHQFITPFPFSGRTHC